MADIVVCSDGTWNTPADLEGGLPAPTNVVKIFNALAKTDASGTEIKRYYHPGVGTDGSWWDRALGGGVGLGLENNIVSAYRWLAGAYEAGDRIWLFGFSRGAFTVRSLSGMISRCGLLDARKMDEKAIWAAADDIFAAYRAKKDDLTATARRPFHGVAAKAATGGSTKIHFVGVWDTVGALGVPDDMALLRLIDDPAKYEFHDTDLSPVVTHARHAVAIDERRQSFTPTLWSDLPPRQDLRQVWFPGVHSDVGGGYGRCGLSDGALQWMMAEAEAAGLAFRSDAAKQLEPDPRGVLHDSLSGVFKALKSRPRQVPRLDPAAEFDTETNAKGALHASALDRQKNPPLSQLAYWPTDTVAPGASKTVDVFAREQWNATGLYLEAGTVYTFKATGEWLDKSVPSGPGGAKDGTFHRGEAIHLISSGWGKAEDLYRRLTGNAEADFWLTKRQENIDWFALVGMIASGDWFDDKGKPSKPPLTSKERGALILNETFKIGAGASFTPTSGGYLYCFANDAWQAYANNKGSVRLTVSC